MKVYIDDRDFSIIWTLPAWCSVASWAPSPVATRNDKAAWLAGQPKPIHLPDAAKAMRQMGLYSPKTYLGDIQTTIARICLEHGWRYTQ